jgi:hypothetical protein
MKTVSVTEAEIINVIKYFTPKNSSSYDEISN